MISRRPNKRASSENVPGPKRKTDAATIVTKIVTSVGSRRFAGGAGIHANATPMAIAAISAAAATVNSPINSEMPIVSVPRDAAQMAPLGLLDGPR